MSASDVLGSRERLSALHTITSLPLDPEFPLFRHYPAMKLGVRESVRYYANLLVPLAEAIIAGQPETTEWVVTAPPLYAIPAGANLIAWEVSRILSLRVVDLRYSLPYPEGPGDYGNSGIEDRIRNRQLLHEGDVAPRPDPADFRDRAVLFINDINVTGTQQHFIQRTLDPLHPASIHWLYIVQVDPDLGRAHPEVEYALNHLSLETFEDFEEIVSRADIDYTSRCISRLFRYPHASLESLVRSLDEGRRKRLHELATAEGKYTGEPHNATLALFDQHERAGS